MILLPLGQEKIYTTQLVSKDLGEGFSLVSYYPNGCLLELWVTRSPAF